MLVPARPDHEEARLQELQSLAILDTEQDPLYDDIVKLSSHIADCPISLLTLVDTDRLWFKAKIGTDVAQIPRDISFCAHTILDDQPLIIEDTLEDTRFADNPLAAADPKVRFYVGHPLTTANGFRLGTLCVMDQAAKQVSAEQLKMLGFLARQASSLLERRRNERALEALRRNSQSLFEKLPAVVVSMKGREHTIDYISSSRLKLFGTGDAASKPLLEVQPEAKQSGLLELLDDVFTHGKTHAVRNASFTVEGVRRHFDFVCTPRFGLSGAIDGVMGVYEDITDRVRLEQAITRLSDERSARYEQLAELVEALPMGIALMEGADHRFVFANRQYREEFIGSSSFVGRHAAEVISEKNLHHVLSELATVRETGRTTAGQEVTLYKKTSEDDEKPSFYNFVYQPSRAKDGQVTGVLAATQNVSAQVHARAEISDKVQKLQEERELRERFVATLTHDLRTPLTAAKMNAQLLGRKKENPKAAEQLSGRIIKNIDRGEAMVQNLLDANRLKAGEGLPVNIQKCSPSSIFQNALSDFETSRGRSFTIQEELTDSHAFWDAEAIRRVLENLTNNAVKYGAPDTPIVVSARQSDETIQLSVHNEGPPIPKGDQVTLFDSYRRTDSALGSGHKGWGIGLTLVKGIAEAHRGAVRVHSEHGKGTTFTIELPVDPRVSP